jgi:acetolactate synthase-1/2/3 large subunit
MSNSNSMKVHEALARAFFDNGVDTMFGLLGDANMFMGDSYIRDCGGAFVAASHEAGATLMALGYAMMSHKVGVCTVTHGPAVTNTVTALVEGVKGQIPCVLICGDTPVDDREHNQNVDQREFITAAGAGFEQLRSAKTVADDVARAIRRAYVERRPIALNVPAELDWLDADYRPVVVKIPERRATISASDDLDNAIGILAAAKRPLILAGRGATSPEARDALLKLAARIDAPVATTLKGKDLFRGDPRNLGVFGTVSSAAAVETIVEADCIAAFGAGLNRYTTSGGAFLKGKRVIQINLEPTEVAKNIWPDVCLVGDPAGTAELIHRWLDEAEIPGSGFFSKALRERIATAAAAKPEARSMAPGMVDVRPALLELEEALPPNRLLVTDGGRFMIDVWTTMSVSGPDAFLTTVNFSSIGLGLPYAIGAGQAHPGRPVVLVTGDGGFMNGGLAEFNTAVRIGADLIVIVCNDGAYGAEHIKFRARQRDPANILFQWPEFANVAVALGGEGMTVRSADDLVVAKHAIEGRKGPLLIDLKIDPTR